MIDCIPKTIAAEIYKRIQNGEINPQKMADMTPKARREYFSTFMDKKTSDDVSLLLDKKMLMVNQERGLIAFINEVFGNKPSKRKSEMVDRVKKMETLLNETNKDAYYADLVAEKLKTKVTVAQANKLIELANVVLEAEKDARKSPEQRRAYGYAKVNFDNFSAKLKESHEFSWRRIIEIPRSVVAALDNSGLFRQGLPTLMTHPVIWARNAATSFKIMYNTLLGEDAIYHVMANTISRDNALNGNYRIMNLNINTKEEDYPTNIPEKMPFLGRFFKASQDAYTGFLYLNRADIADITIKLAEKTENIHANDHRILKDIGILVNSMTGRGYTGAIASKNISLSNALFFSPRLMKANFDVLTGHLFTKIGDGGFSMFARKQAALNLLKITGATAIILAIAQALGWDVEKDPTSTDFGTIRVNDTRFDVTGGKKSLVVLAFRLIERQSKSSVTGLKNKIGTDTFGQTSPMDLIMTFLSNKFSPNAQILNALLLTRKDFEGKPITAIGMLQSTFIPLIIANQLDLGKQPNHADAIAILIAEFLGVSTNTYGLNTDWNVNPNKTQAAFKKAVGNETFTKANAEFNDKFRNWFAEIRVTPAWEKMSDDDKRKEYTAMKKKIADDIIRKKYRFRYKRER
jgi:hypothetical protein